jgi:hypothetical protein
MLNFLNEVLLIEDLEPDAYQMGISGKSGAKNKAPDGGKAGIKGDFNAMHPRYPKGHPQGGKFMPKGSKDQIKAIAKNTGQSVEKVAAAVGGKASANKGKLGKFSGSAGAVGKAQKVLKNKESTPEQRAKAKASIAKAAGKMRGDAPAIAEKPKRGRISNKELMARNAGTSAPVPTGSIASKAKATPPTGSMAATAASTAKKKLSGKELDSALFDKFQSTKEGTASADKAYKILSNRLKPSEKVLNPAASKRATDKSIARNAKKKAKSATPKKKLAGKELTNALFDKFQSTKEGTASADKAYKILSNRLQPSNKALNPAASKRATDKSIARNAKKKAKR